MGKKKKVIIQTCSCLAQFTVATWDISQNLHGSGELLAGLLILAVMVKQTAHVVDVVGVFLRKLL